MTETITQGNVSTTTTQGTAVAEVVPAWAKELNEGIGKMVTAVQDIKALNEKGLQAQEAAAQPPADDEIDEGASTLDDPNLDLLPMSQVAKRILGEVEGVVQKALKPVIEEVGKTRVTAESAKVTEEVNDFARRTPDFGAWGDEMSAVAKQYPTMHIADIYNLAKMRNPEKLAKLNEEADKARKKAEEDKKPKRPAMSLSPGGPTGEVVNEKMPPGDAAKAAWDATVEKFGGSPFTG